ncbi:MAG: hypothetical protein HWD85_03200 [Flavobacteriaceae bacterium]|nr:hypothetical protein [Flavobacteriaceae bacterium]
MCSSQLGYSQKREKSFSISGFVDFNGYHDTRSFSTLTYNILLQLSDRLQYFSLTNHDGQSSSSELTTTYAEHNLRYKLSQNSPLDATLQYVIRNGAFNDDIKLGIRWRLNNTMGLSSFFKKLQMSYSVNSMLVQFRNSTQTKYATQLEHVYRIALFPKSLNNRLYLGGFADQIVNYTNDKISFTWVTEHQLGYRVYKQLYVVAEYRRNEFRTQGIDGLGYGLEYVVKF